MTAYGDWPTALCRCGVSLHDSPGEREQHERKHHCPDRAAVYRWFDQRGPVPIEISLAGGCFGRKHEGESMSESVSSVELLAEIVGDSAARGFRRLQGDQAEQDLVESGLAEYVVALHGLERRVTGIQLTPAGFDAAS